MEASPQIITAGVDVQLPGMAYAGDVVVISDDLIIPASFLDVMADAGNENTDPHAFRDLLGVYDFSPSQERQFLIGALRALVRRYKVVEMGAETSSG